MGAVLLLSGLLGHGLAGGSLEQGGNAPAKAAQVRPAGDAQATTAAEPARASQLSPLDAIWTWPARSRGTAWRSRARSAERWMLVLRNCTP